MRSSPLRQATEADAEAIAGLFDRSYGNSRPTDAEEVRSWLRNEEIDPGDVRVLECDGRVVGYGDVWVESEVQLDVAAPGYWDVFFDWAEQRAQTDTAGRVRAYFPHGHELERVVARRGYRYWRSSYTMEVDLRERPTVLRVPDGCRVRVYDERDEDPLRLAMNEAFADDPFWHTLTASGFREFYLRARGFDPSLWLLACERDELAGFALAYPRHRADESAGWVALLGVRPPWRRRGLGGALLTHAFQALYARGLRRVRLGVDAENPTGAVSLYEKLGMRQVRRDDNWIREA